MFAGRRALGWCEGPQIDRLGVVFKRKRRVPNDLRETKTFPLLCPSGPERARLTKRAQNGCTITMMTMMMTRTKGSSLTTRQKPWGRSFLSAAKLRTWRP